MKVILCTVNHASIGWLVSSGHFPKGTRESGLSIFQLSFIFSFYIFIWCMTKAAKSCKNPWLLELFYINKLALLWLPNLKIVAHIGEDVPKTIFWFYYRLPNKFNVYFTILKNWTWEFQSKFNCKISHSVDVFFLILKQEDQKI